MMDVIDQSNSPINQPSEDEIHIAQLESDLATMQAKVEKLLRVYPSPLRDTALYIAMSKRDAIKAQLKVWKQTSDSQLIY